MVSGTVTVGIGLVLGGAFPVLASVLVGVPAGLTAWVVARRTLARAVGWPVAQPGGPAADEGPSDRVRGEPQVRVGAER